VNLLPKVLGPARSGRGEIAVFPRWALSREALIDLSQDESWDLYAEATNVHDYWWPLVRGLRQGSRAVVFDDTRGVTAGRLSAFFTSVIVLFDTEGEAELLRASATLYPNIHIVVNDRPWTWPGLEEHPADLFVWQRPTRHLARMPGDDRRHQCARIRGQVAVHGSMVIDENLTEPRIMRWLTDDKPQSAGPDNLRFAALRRMAPDCLMFVGARSLRRANWPAAEVTRRRSSTLIGSIMEGLMFRELNPRTARRYVVPRKAVAIVQGGDSLMSHVLGKPAVRQVIGGAPRVRKIFAGTGEVTIALIGRAFGRRPRAAFRFGYGKRAVAGIERHRAALEYLSRGPLARVVPRLLAAETLAAGAYTAETFLSGTAISELHSGSAKDAALSNAAAAMGAYQGPLAARVTIDHDRYESLIGAAFAGIRDLAPEDRRVSLAAVETRIRDALIGREWPLHPVHGDFKGGNVLVGMDSEVTGIIDWDMWVEQGLPLQDVLALAAFDWSVESGKLFGPVLLADLLSGSWRPLYETLIDTEAARLRLQPQQVKVLRAMFWIRHLADRIAPVLQLNRPFASQWVDEPLRQIERYLAS
jgi:Ser/Thr protein kinase RdoA (MazF antagonist)